MKRCTKCCEERPTSEYNRDASRKDGLCNRCRSCRQSEQRARYQADPEMKHRIGMRRFSLTPEDYADLLTRQGGLCALCGRPPKGKRLMVDHDHGCCPGRAKSCGECVRGLLCFNCNVGLGNLGDSVPMLYRAISYLRYSRPLGDPPTNDVDIRGSDN